MEPEAYLLITSAALLIVDLILVGRAKVKLKQSIRGFYACFLSFMFTVFAYLAFVGGFLTSDFSLQQVYSYSSSSMPTLSKLYATWAGSAGSILLLLLFCSIAWFSFRAHGYKKQNKTNFSASLILGAVVLFFIIAAVVINPFARYGVDGPIEGRGLNPVLQSVWMAIHPPIVFAGYVFVVLAFALTLAKMKTGLPNYGRLLNFSAKAGWLFLTLGIGLGGLWAYEVLGWGGYWSWDPVETASLLPWIALTAYFVVQTFPKKEKSLISEALILLAFSSLMLLSALTRGGLLQSIHAYGLSPAGPFILFFAAGMIAYFFHLKRSVSKPLFAIGFERRSIKSASLVLGFASMVGIFLVCFFGIVYPMVARVFDATAAAPGSSFYNFANFPFVLGVIVALFGYSMPNRVTFKGYFLLLCLVAALSCSFIAVGWPTTNVLANAGLPLLGVGLCAGLLQISSSSKNRSFPSVGRALIHLGLVIVLLGVFVSATTQQIETISEVKTGSTVQAVGLTITLRDCTVCAENSSIELTQGIFPQSASLQLNALVSDGSALYSTRLQASLFPAYGFVSQPTVIRTGADDLYIHANVTQEMYDALVNSLAGNTSLPETFTITVERIPMINVIWAGIAFLVTGGIISIVAGWRPKQLKSKP